ncbi:MAG: IS3 family transposase [Floccifex porci]|uniref:IS3 family transposase n=1 Tax=Floccifex porci TaxID=2606629 RepID=UPI0023F4453D|nr:IS3 family transposase [Floccifex porci]MDD7466869.1 IS3 family transposase [Floccifex porci]MDO4501543.1 IS3 family transposase [Erysipelotrichaceae bacterium]
MGRPANIFEIIYDITSKEDNVLTVSELCQMCNVSRSGYYRWIKAEETRKRKEEKDREDFDLILKAYMHRGYDKGAKGIHMQLLHMDPPVVMNEKKIRRLMKKFNLNCPIRKANPYRRMAKALKTSNYSDNLVNREFEKHGPRAILLTDITYLQYNGTFAYLSTILDAYTKQILSYVLSESLKVDFVLDTINQLVEKHGIDFNAETIVHSDQGCHYTSYSFIQILKDNGLRQSMSRRGNCWDNAPQESFYGHMKDEIGKRLLYCESFKDVKELIDDWIDYYNNERYQWQLAKLSPNEFYEYITTGVYPTKK